MNSKETKTKTRTLYFVYKHGYKFLYINFYLTLYIQPVTTKTAKSPVGCTENGNFCPKTKKGYFIPLFKWEINSHIADYK